MLAHSLRPASCAACPQVITSSKCCHGAGCRFFRNIGAICTFALAGTVISTFVVGLMTWAGGAWGFSYHITFIEALVFGSIISTTDTVSSCEGGTVP